MHRSTILSIIAIIVLVALGWWVFRSANEARENVAIANFEECAEAGYPVMESFPRQCRTPDGRLFVEETSNPNPTGPTTSGGCYVGGCSGQICSEDPNAVSTCEFREEYACYKSGVCERQADGKCGWTNTPTLQACLGAVLGESIDTKGK